jgi:hypothetical protein
MLRHSFLFLPGIGPMRERSLWSKGITRWDEFLDESSIRGFSARRKADLDAELSAADRKYRESDSVYFGLKLPRREQWRCIDDFRGSAIYLDIETTGVSPRSPITVVGAYDGSRMHTLVRGQNLTRTNLGGILMGAKMVVTFNGSSFDIPMIESQFPGIIPEIPHVDLRHALRRLGLVGGLKRIERELGIERDKRVEYMTGEDAVYLWRLWERDGKRNAIELLAEYNAEDCRNLKALAEYSYRGLKKRTFDSAIRGAKG